MRAFRIIRSNSRNLTVPSTHIISSHSHSHGHHIHPPLPPTQTPISKFPIAFFSSNLPTPNPNPNPAPNIPQTLEECLTDSDEEEEDDFNITQLTPRGDDFVQAVNQIVDLSRGNPVEMKNKIDECGVKVSQELVLEVLSRIRNDWEAAFTFFLWAGKQPGYAHSMREYNSMISILGKMRKFDTAWALIDEMRGVKTGVCLVTPQTLLILIRRYCAVHDVGRAINTFYAYKRFKFDVGIDEFQSLLSALCRYKNVEDAEHLMFCNRKVYPLNTKSFNIILNGWSNLIGSPREAERVWREMSNRRIPYDVVSYASILSCYSKGGNLHKVLQLYNRMKQMGIEPDRKVYNAVIFALAKGRHEKQAIDLMKTMEEKGIKPNIITYNSLIKPLCKARKIDEAWAAFDEILQRGCVPTIRTYHAFFRALRTGEEVFALLDKMRKTGCQPVNDTYIMLIRKFCRWRQFDDVFKIWNEMSENGVGPDRSSYIVLIHGLFLNGKLDAAYEYYADMKRKGFLPEPKIDELIQTWLSNKQIADSQMIKSEGNKSECSDLGKQNKASSGRINNEKKFLGKP
ncbi:Tetratricopeptide repeat (TPR)-like superfamily protein [Euphorbia peplus]|nr:Tetratricopeptide repeat (TPR)-like superfamily protein [Euphorbia peplus]